MYKNGLVLEGGGLRAIYTSGVLDAFMENDIEFPYVIGVSAGTCNGVSFLGKDIHRMRDISIGYSGDERYMSLKSMLKNGEYLNSKWIFGELSYEMFPLNYDNYENSNAVMCCVATNAKTGKPEYFYPKSLRNGCEELRASCALPIATKPVQLGKDVYYDGGLTDSIPLKRAYDDGCEKCVVILTQDRNYVKKPMEHQRIVRRALKRYPLMAEEVLVRHNMYNAQREYVFEQQKLGNALVICPDKPLNAPTLEKNPQKLREIYSIGYKQGKENIDKVKDFIKY
ncbi:MAG: patatin family protein [Eubacterium sp.]